MGVRVSLKPSDATKQTGFGKQEGIAQVVGARFKAIQHSLGEKKGGGLVTPYLALQFDELYVGTDLKPVDDSEPEQKDYIICWGDSKTKDLKFRFQPAMVKNADDQEPEEVGTSDIEGDDKMKLVEVDSEGNTFVSSDGATPFENSDIGIFMHQLEKLGFKPEIIGRSYAPDFVGLVYEFKTTEKKLVCERLKIKYSPGPERKDAKGVVIVDMCREITKLHVRPYEKGAAKTPAAKTAAGKTNGKATPAQVEDAGGVDDAVIESAKRGLAAYSGKTITKKEFISKVGLAIMKDKTLGNGASKLGGDFTNKIKKYDDGEWTGLGLELDFEVDGDSITVG